MIGYHRHSFTFWCSVTTVEFLSMYEENILKKERTRWWQLLLHPSLHNPALHARHTKPQQYSSHHWEEGSHLSDMEGTSETIYITQTHDADRRLRPRRKGRVWPQMPSLSDQFFLHSTMLAVWGAETKQVRPGILEKVRRDKSSSPFAWPGKDHSHQPGRGRAGAGTTL